MTHVQTAELLQEHINRSQFHQLFKPEVIKLDTERLTLVLKAQQSSALERQPNTEQWHGGAISALVDIVGSYVLTLITPEPMPTINFRTDYLRPAIQTNLIAKAQIRKAGRNIGVVDIDINSDDGSLIAVGRGTYSMKNYSSKSQTNATSTTGAPAHD